MTAIVPVSGRMTASPLDLHAAHGSRTERVRIDDVFVPDDSVLDVEPLADWNVVDRASASDARAHHFGVAAAILRELSDESNPRAVDVAAVWRPRLTRLRAAAYRLSDEAASRGDIAYRVAERLATRVAVGEALATISRALVITRAGRGLAADDTAQLHARNALFVLVQGQRSDIRDAQLAQLAR
ncbi:hypothetical protein ACFOJ6_17260 [Gordonia humi]|uniref:hypothetical protein n=1 Tax=Gordonia humi TaxID=686429 RepID=UPI00360B8EE0